MTIKMKKNKEDSYTIYCMSNGQTLQEDMNTEHVLNFFNDTAKEFVTVVEQELGEIDNA